jgi:predicted AlkP superfamily pyrophosphatase or phosphodiesterase
MLELMRRAPALLLTLLGLIVSLPDVPQAQSPRPRATPPRAPEVRLVLLIAVDQMRYDYLTRFRSEFTGGLAQLLTRGATFTQAYLDHYPTVTAIGHSTMLSGATPALSGIIGNDWYDRALGASVTSVSDPDTQVVGGAGQGASPRRLLVTTLGDELKTAAGHRQADAVPKVFGLSLKDRSAILPVGHRADAAYWLDTKTGAFITSTYYRPTLHPWVEAFNAKSPFNAYAGRKWEYPGQPAEGRTMPAQAGAQLYNAVYGSPFGNAVLKDLAIAAIEHERLGQRGVTDLLSVSFSSNDSVGHTYGPDSAEVHDMTVRTDRTLGELLASVEAQVGLDRAIVVLTADHGVSAVPEVLKERKLPGGRLKADELFGPISAALTAKYGEGTWLAATAGTSPYLNHALIAEKGLDATEVRRVAAAAASGAPHVARVYTRDQLLTGEVPPDTIGRRISRSYNLQRSGDLEIVLEPNWLRSSSGTTHGTPYSYDAHIPLVLMGPRIKAGQYYPTVALNDLAPTLASLLGIENPNGSSGRVLLEAIAPAPAAPPSRGSN